MNQHTPGRPRRSTDPFDDLADHTRSGGRSGDGSGGGLATVYRRRRWMAAVVLLVVAVTLVVLVRSVVGGSGDPDPVRDNDAAALASDAAASTDGATATMTTAPAPAPLPGVPTSDTVGALPPGGDVTRQGTGTWRGVGSPGAVAGDPDASGTRTVTYVVETEQGLDTSSFGGGDAFAATVDATLADPRSWIGNTDDRIAFRHISVSDPETPDLRVRLTTPATTRQLCGGEIELETSCFVSGGDQSASGTGAAGDGRVLINAARWVRGALTFAGDLGSYRQYVVNHEIGHGIGHAAHQACPSDGGLAPVMMQQTLSLANRDLVELDAGSEYDNSGDGGDGDAPEDAVCRANAWPHPEG